MIVDPRWMLHALKLASKAEGLVAPNPMVGCVLVDQDNVLTQGYHKGPGTWHAEREALLDLSGNAPENAILYVNLEPCCAWGRTPPCLDIIVEKGVKKVVVGMVDPDPRMSGEGIKRLRSAGVEVVVGVEEKACKELNRAYLRSRGDRRPWTVLKTASSLDGKIATHFGESKWITSEAARRHVHSHRAKFDGILVGGRTLRADNPTLTTRYDCGRNARPVVLSASGRIPVDSNLLTAGKKPIVLGSEQAFKGWFDSAQATEWVDILNTEQLDFYDAPLVDGNEHIDLSCALEYLVDCGIYSLMVEGGGGVHRSFLLADIADEFWLYMAGKILGSGVSWVAEHPWHLNDAPQFSLIDHCVIEKDIFIRYRNIDVDIMKLGLS